ncbi:MAG: hypothetical protein NT165_02580 [Candidatus Falkowbacteria bacterium]|nr:hypothetical protein [Candidatus Falkowbacteria bacterium]
MKKPIIKTVLIVVLFIVWHLLRTWAQYLVDMQYSTSVAPNQVSDDTMSYQLMKSYPSIVSGINWAYAVGFILLLVWLTSVWWKYIKKKGSQSSN